MRNGTLLGVLQEAAVRKRILAVAVGLAGLLGGCVPQDSLFPLFNKDDKAFEEALIGEWRLQPKEGENPPHPPQLWIFQKSEESPPAYNFRILNFEHKKENIFSRARLVRLGEFLFIDFGSPEFNEGKPAEIPYPAVTSHIFGRIHISRENVRMDMLSDDWVSKQIKTGTLSLACAETPEGWILTAKTEELRKFALEHADDEAAFSESFMLIRSK